MRSINIIILAHLRTILSIPAYLAGFTIHTRRVMTALTILCLNSSSPQVYCVQDNVWMLFRALQVNSSPFYSHFFIPNNWSITERSYSQVWLVSHQSFSVRPPSFIILPFVHLNMTLHITSNVSISSTFMIYATQISIRWEQLSKVSTRAGLSIVIGPIISRPHPIKRINYCCHGHGTSPHSLK